MHTRPFRQDRALTAAIIDRTDTLLNQAATLLARCGATPPRPIIRFDLTGTAAGQVLWRSGERPTLRFNLALARDHRQAFLDETVPHEVAHLVTLACHGRTRPHGAEWRAVMAFFGLPQANRCHDFPIAADQVRRQRRWPYACRCRTHQLSTTRHRRAASGRAHYHCRHCGSLLQPLQHADCAG